MASQPQKKCGERRLQTVIWSSPIFVVPQTSPLIAPASARLRAMKAIGAGQAGGLDRSFSAGRVPGCEG